MPRCLDPDRYASWGGPRCQGGGGQGMGEGGGGKLHYHQHDFALRWASV